MRPSPASCVRRFLILSLIVISVAYGDAWSRHLVTADDLATLRSANWIELSPDGASLAYSVGSDLWIVATAKGSVPRRLGRGTLPRFAPDGRHLLYLSNESGTSQLQMIDLTSHRVTPLTRLAGIDSRSMPTWSPDGRRIVFTASVKPDEAVAPVTTDEEAPLVLTAKTEPSLTLGGVLRGGSDLNRATRPRTASQIFVLDLKSKQVQRITADDLNYVAQSWSPDGRSVVCLALHPRTWSGYRTARSDIYTIDVSARRRTLRVAPGWAAGFGFHDAARGAPRWSPDGTRIAYVGPTASYGHNSVFVMGADGGNPAEVGAKLNRSVWSFDWTADAKSLIVTYLDGATFAIARVDAATGDFEPLTEGEAHRSIVSVSPAGTMAWQQSDGKSHGVIWTRPASGGAAYRLVDLNPQIKEWTLGEQEVVRWRSQDGESLWGILIKPVNYQPGRKYPLIVDPYGNMAAVNEFKWFPMLANQTYAMRGYAVFFPAPRSFHSFPQHVKNTAYAQAAQRGAGGDALIEDVLSGVDTLVERGIVDPQRLGLYGFSTGASAVNYLITRSDRFKAAVSCGGVSDWLHYFLLRDIDDWTIPDMLNGRMPWDDLETYIQRSPIYHLDRVNTPVLLVVGDKDQRLLDHIGLFNGLRRLGREATLVRYPEEGHVIASDSSLRDYLKRVNEFLDKYLKPDHSQAK